MACVFLNVIVSTRSARDEITGWQDGELSVRVRAAPVEGQANQALIRLLASALCVPRADVALVSGARSRHKRMRIEGLEETELRRCLGGRKVS